MPVFEMPLEQLYRFEGRNECPADKMKKNMIICNETTESPEAAVMTVIGLDVLELELIATFRPLLVV